MKKIIFLTLTFVSFNLLSQNAKDQSLKNNIEEVVSELRFMVNYDQALRKYLEY